MAGLHVHDERPGAHRGAVSYLRYLIAIPLLQRADNTSKDSSSISKLCTAPQGKLVIISPLFVF